MQIKGGGRDFTLDAPLFKGRLQVSSAVKEVLAAKKLALVSIDNAAPATDDNGCGTSMMDRTSSLAPCSSQVRLRFTKGVQEVVAHPWAGSRIYIGAIHGPPVQLPDELQLIVLVAEARMFIPCRCQGGPCIR